MSKSRPGHRTLKYIRDRGGVAWIVEKWVSYDEKADIPGRRIDAFGFVDVVAYLNGRAYAIQATSGSNVAARARKIEALREEWAADGSPDVVEEMLAARTFVEVWGWRKVGPRGERKLWKPRRARLTVDGAGALVTTVLEPEG